MSAANEIESAVQRVPIWGWGALGAGVIVIYMAKRNAATKAAATDPNAGAQYGVSPIPDYNTSPGTTPDPMSNPFGASLPLLQSQSALGSATYAPASYSEKLTDILGGGLGSFVNGLPNAPNYLNLTLPGGTSLTESNAIGTFGSARSRPGFVPGDTDLTAMMVDPSGGQYGYNTNTAFAPFAWSQERLATIGAALGIAPPSTPNASYAPNAPAPVPTGVAVGNYSAIRGACAPGDAACAKRVAPWWNGSPIAGWSAGY